MVNLIIRPNALNFVQCMQNGTPIVALSFLHSSIRSTQSMFPTFVTLELSLKKKQSLKTSTHHMGFGIKVL